MTPIRHQKIHGKIPPVQRTDSFLKCRKGMIICMVWFVFFGGAVSPIERFLDNFPVRGG